MTEERKFKLSRKAYLDSDERRRLLDPQSILDLLPLRPGDTVADIGCGTGFFAEPLARAVAPGQLLAFDVQPEMVETTRERAARAGLSNLTAATSPEGRLPLADATLDGALAAFVLHETTELATALAEVRRVLKPGGWFAALEWHRRETPGGPPQHIRLTPEDLRVALAEAELLTEGEARDLNEYHYLLVARRS